MVTEPGAGLHICFPDDKGERVALAVEHGDSCDRCGAKFTIERAGGAATAAEVVAIYRAKPDAELVQITAKRVPDTDATGLQKVVAGVPQWKVEPVMATAKEIKRWLG